MSQSIITAGDASVGGIIAPGNDGTLLIQTGAAGSKVSAINIAADGTPTFLKPIASQGALDNIGLPIYACRAFVNFDGTSAGTFAGGASTVTRVTGQTLCTVTTASAHGLSTGHHVQALSGVVAGDYIITVVNANTFTFNTVATTALTAVAITFDFRLIRNSGNVNSVTQVSTGLYWVNITLALPDANYGVFTTGGGDSATSNNGYLTLGATASAGTQVQTANTLQLRGVNGANAPASITTACIAIFR